MNTFLEMIRGWGRSCFMASNSSGWNSRQNCHLKWKGTWGEWWFWVEEKEMHKKRKDWESILNTQWRLETMHWVVVPTWQDLEVSLAGHWGSKVAASKHVCVLIEQVLQKYTERSQGFWWKNSSDDQLWDSRWVRKEATAHRKEKKRKLSF